MKSLWDQLVFILENHLHFHQLLQQIAEEKRDAIITNEVDALLVILEKEDGILKEIMEVETKRENLQKEMDLPTDITFKDLLHLAPEEMKKGLLGLGQRLLKTLECLQTRNERNAILINESLELNEFSIQLFSTGTEARTYSPVHKKQKEVSYRLLDEKV